MQPEDRPAHEDQHHSHDHAQSDDELEANGPPDHDDLPVVRAGSNSRGDPDDGSIRAAALLIPEVAAGLKPTLWWFPEVGHKQDSPRKAPGYPATDRSRLAFNPAIPMSASAPQQ